MSLLDNASLLLTPNAYKEGKLYSVIPSNGNGDFTATRATTATRVNSAGLVDLVPYNLFTYSEMFSNAAWVKTRAIISANLITAPDGTLTADKLVEDNLTGNHNVQQPVVPASQGSYTFSSYIKKAERTWVVFVMATGTGESLVWYNVDNGTIGTITNGTGSSSTTASITSVGNDWYRCSMTINKTTTISSTLGIFLSTGNNVVSYAGNGTSGLFIWGAQLVEGTSARDYLRTETRLNIPRVDYSLGGCPNILLEPQRTNLALQSSSFDNASWTKTASSVTANSTTSPSGVVDADTLTADGTSSRHDALFAFTATSGTTYTWSVYAKKGTNDFFQLSTGGGFGSNAFANFNLNTGALGTIGSAATATITNVGSGWYRCTMTATATLTGLTGFYYLIVTSTTAARLEVNTLSTSVFLWGAQLEAGAYSTSYIPTTTASVTRNADSITRNNIFTNGLITASGGTWFVELRGNVAIARDITTGGLFINTGTISTIGNGFFIRNANSTPIRMTIGKVESGTITNLYTTLTDTIKVAIKWNGSTADVFVNGIKQVSATAFTTTAMQNLIADGINRAVFINETALFPTPLTDAQCLALTA